MTTKKLSIAIILPQALDKTSGGVQRSTWQIGHYLGLQGWHVVFISLAAKGHIRPLIGDLYHPTVDEASSSDGTKLFIEQTLHKVKPDIVVNQVGLTAEPAETLWKLREYICNYSVVSCFRNNPAFFRENYRHIVRNSLRKVPWIFQLIDHALGWQVILAFHRWKNRAVFLNALAHCNYFMVLSPTFISELRWYVPNLDEQKVFAIPNGFPITGGSEQQSKKNRLLFVGRIENGQKNVFMLPRLWKILQSCLTGWELHVVGEGNDLEELKSLSKEMGLERLQFHGRQAPAEHYRDAKVFLMLSTYEGFGNTLIEAQMHGVVPVAFRSYSAIEWMLNDGVDAFLIEPFNIEEFAAQVERLAVDKEKWNVMSNAARSNAQRFSEEIVGRQWNELLHSIARQKIGEC